MAREIIDLTRSPSPDEHKPDLRQLETVDRKPVIRSIAVTPLGPAKRVAGVSAKKGKVGVSTGKTPVVKRDSGWTVKQELHDDLDLALPSRQASDSHTEGGRSGKVGTVSATRQENASKLKSSLLLPKQTSSFLSDSEDEVALPPRLTSSKPPSPSSRPVAKVEIPPSPPRVPPTPRTIARTPRRHVRDPDSESEADTGYISPSPAPSPPSTSSRTAATPRAKASARSSKADVRKYLDLYAGADDASEDDEEDEKSRRKRDKDWMDKYYDDSLGSLKDFIVPDDYESSEVSESEGSAAETDDESGRVVHSDGAELEGSDDEVLHFSPPPKLLKLPDLGVLSLVDSDDDDHTPPILDTLRTPGKTKVGTRSATAPKGRTPSKKAWATERTVIAQAIFDELDRKVFGKRLGRGEGGAGAVLEWNNRLLTTAGTAHSKWTRHADGSKTESVKIVLSEKVLTGKDQILCTVAHEMCHLASWIISNERKNPHGRVFKSWGAKVMRARPDIEVTTKHTYEIEYKYSWKCTGVGCSKIYKRHSKLYLKAHMADAKASMPGESHAAVMRALSARWKEGEGDAEGA